MARPKHEALLDLEHTLAGRVNRQWSSYWRELGEAIEVAIEAGDFTKALRLASEINLDNVTDKSSGVAETVGLAALFLGVSRVKAVKKSGTYADPPLDLVDSAQDQFEIMLKRNVADAIRQSAVQSIGEAELTSRRPDADQDSDFRDILNKRARSLQQMTASLHVSRLSTLGFMKEALLQRIEVYQINEVLDGKVCSVCRTMHGKQLPVSFGYDHITQSLSVTDPDTLKSIAPWPKQNPETVRRLSAMTPGELSRAGFATPPFHGGCRGIVTKVNTSIQELALESSDVLAGSGIPSNADLTALLFGQLQGLV